MLSKYYRTESMQRCTVLLVLYIVDFVLLLLAIYRKNIWGGPTQVADLINFVTNKCPILTLKQCFLAYKSNL